jgi:hypothetical protein
VSGQVVYVPAPAPDEAALAALKSYSRLAVLAERERCVKTMVKFFNAEAVGGGATPLMVALVAAIREGAE